MEPISSDAPRRMLGAVKAIVTNIADPEGLGRVKLRFPWLSDSLESNWAQVAAPVAGPNRGLFLMPEVDDQVLVVFENGDINHPFVVGGLWNKTDKAPVAIADGKNNLRVWKSKSGHCITLDDTDGSEKIVICDKSGNSQIILDSSGAVTIKAGGTLKIDAGENILVQGGGQGAARVNDPVKSAMKDDPAFWTWVSTLMNWLAAHTHTGNLGAPTSPPMIPFPGKVPSECAGTIIKGSEKVKVGG